MTPSHGLRRLFFSVIVRPFLAIVLGVNARNRERLPASGPAILASNHNSHLDTLLLLTLVPDGAFRHTRPVAAADYFLSKRWLAWFAIRIIGILPVRRKLIKGRPNPLELCVRALQRKQILLFFPEGSRGEPEQLQEYKAGLARLAEAMPTMPVVPIYCHGLGKALPKGEALLVPFFADVFVGDPIVYDGCSSRKEFMDRYAAAMEELRKQKPAQDYK